MQGLTLTILAKIVAVAGAERIRPNLPTLVPALLEALSGLEVQERHKHGICKSISLDFAH